MQAAKRLEQIGAYLFADLDRKQAELTAKGVDVISLSVGDPDLPTPAHIVDAMMEGASDARTHRYPPYGGTKEFRQAAAAWFARRFGVTLNPDTEVLALIGSKEGLAHLPWAILNPGDVALIPDPGYPVYRSSTILAEGVPYAFPLTRERGFLPDFRQIPPDVLQNAKLLFLNYPNNPTAATAPVEFFAEAVAFAKQWNLLLVHDNAYSEIGFDGYRAPSVLEIDGAKDVAIEFHSLSKTFCMTGWRIGFAAGNAEAIKALATMKTNIDSGVFRAIQQAGIAGLTGPTHPLAERLRVFQDRRDRVLATLRRIGWEVPEVKATLYVWVPVPGGASAAEFASQVLDRTGVLITPGTGYGKQGEGYVRLSLTVADDRLDEAMQRLEKAFGPARIPSVTHGSPTS
jgi:LL-diaminopimelate aminotransferase